MHACKRVRVGGGGGRGGGWGERQKVKCTMQNFPALQSMGG